MLNQEQVKSGARSIILGLAGFVGGLGVGQGWYSQEQLTSFLSSEVVIAAATFLGTLIYGLIMNGRVRLMTAAAGVNPESVVVTTPTKAKDSPADNVVPVGSPQAKAAATELPK
jgi:hypothetical protein